VSKEGDVAAVLVRAAAGSSKDGAAASCSSGEKEGRRVSRGRSDGWSRIEGRWVKDWGDGGEKVVAVVGRDTDGDDPL
jgi:hypothetical protein